MVRTMEVLLQRNLHCNTGRLQEIPLIERYSMWADLACPLSTEPSILLPPLGGTDAHIGSQAARSRMPIGEEDAKILWGPRTIDWA